MRFEKLALQNVGLFRGSHSLDLTSTAARPIVLLGALNGSGKTTVIEALQLALYGRRAAFGWRGVSPYPAFLQQLRNRNAPAAEPMAIELTLRLSDERKLRVKRAWTFSGLVPRESVMVFADGSETPDPHLSEDWDEEVERILPVRLSELFFFDGERIEQLADPARSGAVIKSAVSALMGLDLVDHLAEDLDILRGRMRQRVQSPEEQARARELAAEVENARAAVKRCREAVAANQSKLDHVTAQLAAAKSKLESDGGERFRQRESLSQAAAVLRERVSSIASQGKEIAAGSLPLLLVYPELRSALDRAVAAADSGQGTADARREELDRLRRWINSGQLPATAAKRVMQYIESRVDMLSRDAAQTPSDAVSLRRDLELLLQAELPRAMTRANDYLKTESALSEQLLRAEEQLRHAPELDQLTGALQRFAIAEERVISANQERAALLDSLERNEVELARLSAKREEDLERTRLSKEARRSSDYCDRARASLRIFREKLVQSRRSQLEHLVLEAFRTLVRKHDLVQGLEIDAESMAVRLFGEEAEIPVSQLSAGERQLLAVAILWGLAKASGRPVPVVIDTPLGRLDGEHRRALLERYFPRASHQVVLLSTDQEVDVEFSELLDVAVARRMLIEYNAGQRSSAFTPGYFGAPA